MRHFAASRFRLWNLSPAAKLVYTLFSVFSLLAILSSVLLYEDLVGPSLRTGHLARVGTYYGPAEKTAPKTEPTSASPAGPAIELPPDEPEVALHLAMPYRKLLEVTHFHLFTIPVFLLVLTHLYVLTGAGPTAQLVWILLAWGAALLHMVAPWLLRYGSRHFAALYPTSGFLLFVSCLWLSIQPVWVMWRGKTPPKTEAPQNGEPAPPFSD